MKSIIWNERKPIDETCTYKYWSDRAWGTVPKEVKEDMDEDAIEAFQRFIKENRR